MKFEDNKGPKTSGSGGHKKLKTSIVNQVKQSMAKLMNDFE